MVGFINFPLFPLADLTVSQFLMLLLLLLSFFVTGFLSSLVLMLLSQWLTPPLWLQVSAYSTFLMMCDVPSMAVFCRESIECCPGIVSRYYCKLLLTIPVAPMITGMTKHFMFHILWISVRFLYFNYYYYLSSEYSEFRTCRNACGKSVYSGTDPFRSYFNAFDLGPRSSCLASRQTHRQ
jgi:hypothetical protein